MSESEAARDRAPGDVQFLGSLCGAAELDVQRGASRAPEDLLQRRSEI
jgi:hypothetical protein